MNTWVAYATAHASLASGIGAGLMPAFGSASLYGFALGASAAALALVVAKSPRTLNLHWRLADRWSRAVQLTTVLLTTVLVTTGRLTQTRKRRTGQSPPPMSSRSRIRRRVDLMLLQMLGDEADEHSESCPAAVADESRPARGPETAPAPAPTGNPDSAPASTTRGYRSKHRLAGPAKDSPGHKRTPRHAAPPATFTAKITNAR